MTSEAGKVVTLDDNYQIYEIARHRQALIALGINVEFENGVSNWVALHREHACISTRIKIHAGNRNWVIIGPHSCSEVTIQLFGSDNIYRDDGLRSWPWKCDAVFRGDGAVFEIGAGATAYGLTVALNGSQGSVSIGKDCMISRAVEILPSDSHAIIDLVTEKVLNAPSSIVVGAHVWLGSGTMLLKGVSIGQGSVIAARSLVTNSISEFTLAVGSPAREHRRGISWTRSAVPTDKHLLELRELQGLRGVSG